MDNIEFRVKRQEAIENPGDPCYGCHEPIGKGEIAILSRVRYAQGPQDIYLLRHVKCFQQLITELVEGVK